MAKEWLSVTTNPGNVKELIPEFFLEDPDFLVNKQKLDLGLRSNCKRVDDAKLPRWAASPEDFLRKHRAALESDFVSRRLHLWVDLIFGCKQRSIEDFNVFHPLTYEGSVDFERLQDPVQRLAFEVQITEFGQTPRQLFRQPHPPKFAKVIPKGLCATDESIQSVAREEQKLEGKLKQTASLPEEKPGNLKQAEVHEEPERSALRELSQLRETLLERVHKDCVTSVHVVSDEEQGAAQRVVTTSMDGFIKMHDTREGATKKAFFISQSGINSATPLSSQDSFAVRSEEVTF